jgi:CubicO group peptidase (beta-lactamase class C family)
MKKLLVIATLAVSFSNVAYAQQLDSAIEARIERVENGLLPAAVVGGSPIQQVRLGERMTALNVPGISIAVINNGVLEWARGFGLADVASGRPVNEHTKFQAASISKPVTAMAAMSLVQAGKLSLDEDVNLRLVAWKLPMNDFTAQRKVTLRGLLSHTAGIGVHGFHGYAAGKPIPTLLEVLDGKAPANSNPVRVEALPGSAWKYSGGGYEIVQLMLTETTREPFDRFVQHTVLDKIGMNESTFILPAKWEAAASSAYHADGREVPGKWHRYPEMAAASLWTTPSDLARFVIEIQKSASGKSNKVLSQKMINEMLTPGIEDFGLGLFLGEKADARRSFYHGGGNEGIRNMMFAYTSTGQGAIVMTNSDNGQALIDEVLRAIAREYGWTNYLVEDTPTLK